MGRNGLNLVPLWSYIHKYISQINLDSYLLLDMMRNRLKIISKSKQYIFKCLASSINLIDIYLLLCIYMETYVTSLLHD